MFFILGLTVALTYWPGMNGAAEASRWSLMAFVLPPLLFLGPIKPNRTHWLGLAFLVWAVETMLWAPVRADGTGDLIHWGLVGLAFLVGTAITDMRWLFRGLGLGLWVSSGLAIAELCGLHPMTWMFIPTTAANLNGYGGLFINANLFAEFATAVLVGLLAYGSWWIAAGIVLGIALSGCRSAIVALGVCGLYYAWGRWRWKAVAGLPIIAGLLFLDDPAKWTSGVTLGLRMDLWHDTISGLTLFGHGVGSFNSVFPLYGNWTDASVIQPAHAHNDLLEIAFELGLPGVVLALLFAGTVFKRADQGSRYVLIATGITGCFGFPLFEPSTAFLFGIVAGHAGRAWSLVRNDAVHGGQLLHDRGKRVGLFRSGQGGQQVPV
jgi:hypothetical protein